MNSKISKLQQKRDQHLLAAQKYLGAFVSSTPFAVGFLGFAIYNFVTEPSEVSGPLVSTGISFLWAQMAKKEITAYKKNRYNAKEIDCDIFEANGGDITDCKFPKYIRSQFYMDNEPT